MHVLVEREDISIHVLAKPQPKASANSNAEPGNAGLNLTLRCYRRSLTTPLSQREERFVSEARLLSRSKLAGTC
jgi:hypothetical protein